MSLNAKLVAQVIATLSEDLDLGAASAPLGYTKRLTLLSGTGANQADVLWHDQRTLAAATAEDLDLAGGSLVDALGNPVTFARVKGLIVAAAAGNGDNIEIGGDAAAFASWLGDPTDVLVVRPGGLIAAFAPDAVAYPVTAATADILQITNADAGDPATYDIVLIGASA